MSARAFPKSAAASATAAALIVGLAANAFAAKAFCLNIVSGMQTSSLIAKGFKAPAPGKCKPFGAIYVYSGKLWPVTVSGSACSIGSQVSFNLTAQSLSAAPGGVAFYTATLPGAFPSAGKVYARSLTGATTTLAISAETCDLP